MISQPEGFDSGFLILLLSFAVPMVVGIAIVWWTFTKLANKTVGKKYPYTVKEPQKLTRDPGFWLMAVPVGGIIIGSVIIIAYSLIN